MGGHGIAGFGRTACLGGRRGVIVYGKNRNSCRRVGEDDEMHAFMNHDTCSVLVVTYSKISIIIQVYTL